MKIFVAGAAGAIGRPLIATLVAKGHVVFGMTKTSSKATLLQKAGAVPVIADALDREAVLKAICEAAPQVVINQLTAIPERLNLRHFSRDFELTNRLRIEGTDHLLAGARRAGVDRVIAQSFAGWPYAREGSWIKNEEDALDEHPPAELSDSLNALRHLENAVLKSVEFDGLVFRYGAFYGPGTSISRNGFVVEEVRRRRFPMIGAATAVWSFLHVDDAASATAAGLTLGRHGIYNIVDDDPAPVREWLPFLAQSVGAKPPLRVPAWIAKFGVGEHGVTMMTETRGASNAKVKRDLNWEPQHASWRKGFAKGL